MTGNVGLRLSRVDDGGEARLGTLDACGGLEALERVPRFIGKSRSKDLRVGESASFAGERRCSARIFEPVFRERLLDKDAVPVGPDRGFPGMGRAGDFGAEGLPLGLAFPLFLRSKGGVGLTRAGLRERLSRTTLISGGMAI